MLLPGDPAFDAALAGIIEADDEPEGVEATDAGPANVLASEGLSFVTPEPDTGRGAGLPTRSSFRTWQPNSMPVWFAASSRRACYSLAAPTNH